MKLLLWFEWNVVFVAFVVRGRRGVPVSLERARHSAREREGEREKEGVEGYGSVWFEIAAVFENYCLRLECMLYNRPAA